MPGLPFKVGHTINVGGLFGKVEATNLVNTRVRTFDGKTFFVPNTKVLNDIVQNYHYTPDRRIKLDLAVRYEEDLMRVKQIFEAIMIEDPRVLVKPRPVVWVMNLTNGCVQLGGRCWVSNTKFWPTRCELLENIKLRFDHEGIQLVPPQVGVQYYGDGVGAAAATFDVAREKVQ
jgi:small conductance mechanosensitive channel